MNWKNLFFISTIFWIGMLILANCSQKVQTDKEVVDKVDSGDFVDCSDPKNAEKCAEIKNRIAAYKDFTDKANLSASLRSSAPKETPSYEIVNGDTLTWDEISTEMSLLRGYNFSIDDLRKIVAYADLNDAKSVYTMLSFNTSEKSEHYRDSLGTPIKYLDLYFQVEKQDGSFVLYERGESMDDDGDGGYADFPKPCPNYCPD